MSRALRHGIQYTVLLTATLLPPVAHADRAPLQRPSVQLGPRPYYLVDDLPRGELKARLERCSEGPFSKSDFSIGHRGAALQFPEHTKQSYEAAARMGAGILECDVTFTRDRELVCRHSQCDLHTTTNILAVPELAGKCSVPFTPADPESGTPASAQCCTSDITLAEFRTLCGKMDASNPDATTVEEYLGGTPAFRTDLYATCGTLLSHAESIALLSRLGTKFTPELKATAMRSSCSTSWRGTSGSGVSSRTGLPRSPTTPTAWACDAAREHRGSTAMTQAHRDRREA